MILFLKATIPGGAGGDLFAAPVTVGGYVNKQGTFVAPHASVRHKKRPEAPGQSDLFATPAPEEKPAPKKRAAPAVDGQIDLFADPTPEPPKADFAFDVLSKPALKQYVTEARGMTTAARAALAAELRHRSDHGEPAWTADWQSVTGPDGQRITVNPDTGEAFRGGILTTAAFARRMRDQAPSVADQLEPAVAPEAPDAAPAPAPAAAGSDRVAEWGVPPGTGKAARKRANAAALAILQSKTDKEMTPQDRQALARYTGRGGIGDSLNEFYTDPAVAGAMWRVLETAGFAGGDVLEPSCFVPSTLVQTVRGWLPIDEVIVGDRVIGHDGRYHDVMKLVARDHVGSLVSLEVPAFPNALGVTPDHELSAVRVARCTADKTRPCHIQASGLCRQLRRNGAASGKFRCGEPWREYAPGWVRAADLRQGDYLVEAFDNSVDDLAEITLAPERTPNLRGPLSIPCDPALMRAVGIYLAEGSADENTVVFTFRPDEKDILDALVAAFRPHGWEINEKGKGENGAVDYRVYSRSLVRFFSQFGRSAATKRIPNWCMLLPPEKQAALLRGVWRGDGGVNDEGFVSVNTVSRDLALGVRGMLYRLGIVPAVRIRRAKAAKTILGRPIKNELSVYSVHVSGVHLDHAVLVYGVTHPALNKRKFTINRTGSIDGAKVYHKVSRVSSFDWSGPVHDLTVEEASSYGVGLCTAHNCGTGVFLHTAPANARVTAVELDPTSARIASILHGADNVHNASLERFATQDGRQFDAVIGNVPFGLRGKTIRDDKPDLATAESYFVDTALDKLKDGGLLALIVPTGIMDAANGRAFREQMLTKGEFLGAHRLPNTAFEASHTDVTSDIILLRKRPQDVAGALGAVDQDALKRLGAWDPEFLGGAYFSGAGKDNVYGQVGTAMRAFGEVYTVNGSMEGVADAVAGWHPPEKREAAPITVERVLEEAGGDPAARKRIISAALKPPYEVAKPGDIRVVNGVRYVLQGEPPRWHRAEDEIPDAVDDARFIGESLDDLLEGRAKNPAALRASVTAALDDYVKLYGLPSRNKELLGWISHPHMPRAEGVEPEDHAAGVKELNRRIAHLLGAVGEDGRYSDLVTGASRDSEGATIDTIATKLALERGAFTAAELAAAWGHGTPADEALDHLFANPAYAVLPGSKGDQWTTLNDYIAGDLWEKYDANRAAAADPTLAAELQAKFAAQADTLEAAIAPQSLDDVETRINSPFITPALLTSWWDTRLKAMQEQRYSAYTPKSITWTFEAADGLWNAEAVGGPNGTFTPKEVDLLLKWLNRTGSRREDQPTIERLNSEFRDWLLSSPERDATEERYNRLNRGFRPPAYSDAPIAIPGLNPAIIPHSYHFSGLRWALAAGKGIVADDVGLGKTPRGLMIAKLKKVSGEAKKPLIVVPKSVLGNWLREAEVWFPGSKVLTIGETYSTKRDGTIVSTPDNEETRRRKLHDMQQNDYDFIFMSQPAWNDLAIDPVTKAGYESDEFWNKRGRALANAKSKAINKARTAHDQAQAAREFMKKEGTVFFDELGVDLLIMDEGHAFKNLYKAKQRWGETPKFLGGSGESKRAQDTFYKTRRLRDMNGGRGVYMLTATPTKNSPLEVYSMLAHIAPEAFERLGIKNAEEFLDRFCEFGQDTILNLQGEYEEDLVTTGFKNLSELREVMRRFIDRKTAEDVGLKLPKAERLEHMVDMTDDQHAAYAELREAAAGDAGSDDTGDSHIFSIMSRMDKASLDMALLGQPGGGAPKIEKCVENAVKGAAEGGQIIFCDAVAAHDRIADALVRAGVPREKIGILNAGVAPSVAQRQRIADDFNAGKIAYVIGNTDTMGEGMNLQKQTADIHHLDQPWNAAILQQRNGRGLRQGNKLSGIRIHTYLAKGSFDGYRYQTVASKKDWQDLLWNGGDRIENLGRDIRPDRSGMLIALSADPDAALAQYQSDKAAAETRKAAEHTGRALDNFNRYQTMHRSLAGLVAAGGPPTTAMRRLEVKIAQLHTALSDNKWFTHKDLLTDNAPPALVEINTHNLFRDGVAFELDPRHAGGERRKWVVSGINLDRKQVDARPWGGSRDHVVSFGLDELKDGVTTSAYDAAAEAAHVQAETEAKAAAMAEAIKSGADPAAIPKLSELHKLAPEVIEALEPYLQKGIKQGVREYRDHDGAASHRAMVAADGAVKLVPGYKIHGHLNDHDFLLPTREGREKAINAYLADRLGRKVSDKIDYNQRSGKTKKTGLEANYESNAGSASYSGESPWRDVLKRGFGAGAEEEGRSRFKRAVTDQVQGADTFEAAMRAAAPAMQIESYGGPHRWPKWAARALWDKAKALDLMDKPMSEVVKHDPTRLKATLHHDMIHPEGGVSQFNTVRRYLERALPLPADRDEEAKSE